MTIEVSFAEDLHEGLQVDLGSYDVTHDEIVAFASKWDPQPMHTDDDAAAKGFFGEVIASGMHTIAIYQRLAVLGAYEKWAVVAGRSIRSLELPRPVRAGMTLDGSLEIGEISFRHPERALVMTHGKLTADGETVLTVDLSAYLRRRP